LAPVGLSLPCKGSVLGEVPQLVLLDEVDAQDEVFIEVGDNVELMGLELGADSNLEFISDAYWQRLASNQVRGPRLAF
jgi:hypothetical protein